MVWIEDHCGCRKNKRKSTLKRCDIIIIIIIIIFILRLPERDKPIELATVKQQNISVKTKIKKSKKKK